ncbi:uncharacterized protein with ParB-like and HNH nuclease domain [Streptomyces canus]|uniref:Uncharacterized protein with ParB-like and HNH nuclease domain n=1 Tax=Streptomyces canus TaxID=58343 RepID=A0AAW8FMQ1_9ACTN|nr:DUF262 domain-containing protein [Streptomyces canus]MDQ0911218.1 uncharacterized protein with ParB-like and HNH nuclease domain [Streptomyces canus]
MEENEDWDDRDGEETTDLSEVGEVERAVVTDTDWTAETILSQLRRGNIQLNPRFQRRDAWDRVRKSRFIESLILGLPIPQIVLAEDKRRRGKFIVIDGKQRLLALRQFASGSSFSGYDTTEFDGYSLSGLDVRSDLRNYSLKKLEDDPDRIDDLNELLNQTIRTVVVRNWPDEEFLNLVFLRLNTGSVRLSPQELRQALHPGNFTDFLDDFAIQSESLHRALRLRGPDFRMRDVEILLRFFAFSEYLTDYSGNLKYFLDETLSRVNHRWDQGEEEYIKRVASECELAIEATFSTFGHQAFYRWSRGKYEGRFNRAVFDIMTFYFKKPQVRTLLRGKEEDVKRAFEALCTENVDFNEALQTTTKTPEATHRRLALWGEHLQDIIEHDLNIPELHNNRLVFRS